MKRRYVKDYTPSSGGSERYRYTGDYYVHGIGKESRRKAGIWQILLAGVELLLLLLIGFMDCPGTYTMYVLLPLVCMMLPILYYIMGSYAYMKYSNRLERYQYDESFVRMMHSVSIAFFFNLFALCGDVFLIIRNIRKWEDYSEFFLLVVIVLLAIMNYTAFSYHRYLMKQVQKEENRNKKSI